MIRGYSDHAANERTFLAWVRTGLAVIAFGFVIEKFNLFVSTIASASLSDGIRGAQFARLSGPLGRYEGLALIVLGIALLAIAAVRFIRTERLLADEQVYSAAGVRIELLLSGTLALIAAGLSGYFALG